EGVLEIAGLVNPECLSGHRVVFIGVKLASLNLVEKGKEFSKLRGVVSVSVVTGRFDLILMVLLREGFDLLEFYTREVYRLKDVRSVETFVVYKGYNLKVPYIL
ncbi:MAG TPA: Lrp/AsnC ligand binding domain-containing protein, partial [Desulfobacterales bacterium]